MTTTVGSQLDLETIKLIELTLHDIRRQIPRWQAEVPSQLEEKINDLVFSANSLVAKANLFKHTEKEYFKTAYDLGIELLAFAQAFSIMIPLVIINEIVN